MKLLPFEYLGAFISKENKLTFRIPMPGVKPSLGKLYVKIIHIQDQLIQSIDAIPLEMQYTKKATFSNCYGENYNFKDVWSLSLPLDNELIKRKGQYLYRYCFIKHTGESIDWIIDPFAQKFGTGKMSLFEILDNKAEENFPFQKNSWKVPPINKLVIYELHIQEFAGNIRGVIEKLPYLQDLGINCLQIMPISNIRDHFRWGYLPIGYFGVDERLGTKKDFQELVSKAHSANIAVILDVVYAHTDRKFGYFYLYKQLFRTENNPITNGTNSYGARVDYSKSFARDFFFTVNHFLLNTFQIDGFRYDYVAGYYNVYTENGYTELVYNTHQHIKNNIERYPRFKNSSIIQCAEYLTDQAPEKILKETYSNCCYQNSTWGIATQFADKKNSRDIGRLGLEGYGLHNFPTLVSHGDDIIQKTALQYIENHDHKRFICNWQGGYIYTDLYGEGNRELNSYKVQPFLIGLLTAKGIPLIWQGQEIGENHYMPEQVDHIGRVVVPRAVRWEFFYDKFGKAIIRLVRKLISIRNNNKEFTEGSYYFYNFDYYIKQNVLVFSRKLNNTISIVLLNFNEFDLPSISLTIPKTGICTELLEKKSIGNVQKGNAIKLYINSNYGIILKITG